MRWDNELAEADLARAPDGGIDEGDELWTAVLISLFTDAPAQPEDALPEGVDARGWWGDAYPDDDEPRGPTGSRLWVLGLEPVTATTAPRARDYALEALEWMRADGIASAVDVTATRLGGGVALSIAITLTDGTRRTYEVPNALR